MLFGITDAEVAALDDVGFQLLMRELMEAERERLGMPRGSVSVPSPLAVNIADGGVDALADAAPAGSDSLLPDVASVWQFKAEAARDVGPAEVTKALSKGDVEPLLRSGRRLCLALTGVLNRDTRGRREKAATEWFRRNGLPPNFRILDASDIARWAQGHPSLELLPIFSRPSLGGLHRLDDPAAFVGHEITFAPDSQREASVEQIRQWLDAPSAQLPARIEGPAGVGKSRLALEALRGSTWPKRALYCPDAGSATSNLHNLLHWLRTRPSATLALVVDECDHSTAHQLSLYVASAPDRIRLLTIGTDTRSMGWSVRDDDVIVLDALKDEAMRGLLSATHPSLAPQDREFIVDMCGGYVKLSVNLASAVGRNDSPRSAGALALEVEDALRMLIPDQADHRAMKALSLLQRVGVLDEVAGEGHAVAGFMGLSLADLLDAPMNRNSRPFVARAGRYRYVTPRLLAVWLAGGVWERRDSDMLRLLRELPSADSQRSFLERVLDVGDEGRGAQLVGPILSPQGPYKRLTALSEPELANLIEVLVQLAPREGLAALERVLDHLPRDELLGFLGGRREVVRALQHVAWYPECFERAARLLLALAEAENESWANNASGVWTSLFLTHLGGTSLPAVARHALLREVLGAASVARRLLAVRAIGAALSSDEIGDPVGEVQGGRPVPGRWRPATWGEEWEARRSALSVLDAAMDDADRQVRDAAVEVLLDKWVGLARMALADDVLQRLEHCELPDERHRARLRAEIDRAVGHDAAEMPDDIRARLEDLRDRLEGATFGERLRRWTGPSAWRDSLSAEGQGRAADAFGRLAAEALEAPGLLEPELEWLSSQDAVRGMAFGQVLGEGDTELRWLPTIRAEARAGSVSGFASGYLEGAASARNDAWLDDELDQWTASGFHAAPMVVLTDGHGPSERGLHRLVAMGEARELDGLAIHSMNPAWAMETSAEALSSLVQNVLLAMEPPAIGAALNLLTHRLAKGTFEGECAVAAMWRCLETDPGATWADVMGQYYWKEVAQRLVEVDAQRVARAWLAGALKARVHIDGSDDLSAILIAATERDPEGVWGLVSERLLPGTVALPIWFGLQGWYGRHVGTKVLLQWAEAHAPEGPGVAAHVCPVEGNPLDDPARSLLVRFDDDAVRSALTANFVSGTFTGPTSAFLEAKSKAAQDWCRDSEPAVQRWAAEMVSGLSVQIEDAKRRDEEWDTM